MAKAILEHRLIAALVLCLSGLALIPFNPFTSRVFGWEQLAGAYDLIFADDFEDGNPKHWSYRAPEHLRVLPVADKDAFEGDYLVDKELLSRFESRQVMLVSGFTEEGEPVFSIESRLGEDDLELRIGAAVAGEDWRHSDWQALGRGSRLSLEWQRSHPQAADGSLFLSVDGVLAIWLTELDNSRLPLAVTGLTQTGARTLLTKISSDR